MANDDDELGPIGGLLLGIAFAGVGYWMTGATNYELAIAGARTGIPISLVGWLFTGFGVLVVLGSVLELLEDDEDTRQANAAAVEEYVNDRQAGAAAGSGGRAPAGESTARVADAGQAASQPPGEAPQARGGQKSGRAPRNRGDQQPDGTPQSRGSQQPGESAGGRDGRQSVETAGTGDRYCPECGTAVSADVNFCGNCGTQI